MDRLHQFCAAWPLFADSALTGLFAGALLGGLGVFVLLGRMAFVSAALAQVASLGVALGLAAQAHLAGTLGAPVAALSAAGGATLATTLGATLLAFQARLRPQQLEALLALLFAAGSAGTLVVAGSSGTDLHDVQSLLFGSAVAVPPGACLQATWLAGVLLAATAFLFPALTEAWCDPQGAQVRGLPLRALQAYVLVALVVAIAFTTQMLGALPVFALSLAPALAATHRCRSLGRSFAWAVMLGAGAGFCGYVLAFCWDWPVGATQALVAVACAAVSWAVPRRPGDGQQGAEPNLDLAV